LQQKKTKVTLESKTEPQEIKLFPSFNDSFTRYSLELMCPFSIFWILLLNYLLLMYCVGNVALCFLHRHLRAFVFFWTFTFQSLFSTTITFPTPLVFHAKFWSALEFSGSVSVNYYDYWEVCCLILLSFMCFLWSRICITGIVLVNNSLSQKKFNMLRKGYIVLKWKYGQFALYMWTTTKQSR